MAVPVIIVQSLLWGSQIIDKKAILFKWLNKKKQIGSVWDFPRPATLFCNRCINLYFKINVAFFCCSLFFKEYFNLWIRFKKWQKWLYQFSTKLFHERQGYFRPLAFSRNFSQFFFKAVYVTIVGVNLEIYDV